MRQLILIIFRINDKRRMLYLVSRGIEGDYAGYYYQYFFSMAIISGIIIISAGSERIEYKSGMILLER